MPAEDGDRRDDEADRSTLDRLFLSVAGGDGGLQDGGFSFNPAIRFSEINFLKLLKSSFSSEPPASAAAAAASRGSGTSSSSPAGGGGGGGGSGISSGLALLFLRSGFELAPPPTTDFELLLLLGTVFGRLLLLFWGLRFDCLVLPLADLTSILCTKLVGDTPDMDAAGAPSGGIRSPWGSSAGWSSSS